jgi:hypothetical protein
LKKIRLLPALTWPGCLYLYCIYLTYMVWYGTTMKNIWQLESKGFWWWCITFRINCRFHLHQSSTLCMIFTAYFPVTSLRFRLVSGVFVAFRPQASYTNQVTTESRKVSVDLCG